MKLKGQISYDYCQMLIFGVEKTEQLEGRDPGRTTYQLETIISISSETLL